MDLRETGPVPLSGTGPIAPSRAPVRSREGHGSTFRLSIPAGTPSLLHPPGAAGRSPGAAAGWPACPSADATASCTLVD